MTVGILAAVAAVGVVLAASVPASASLGAQRPALPGVAETWRGARSVRLEGPVADGRRLAVIDGVTFRHGTIEFDIAGEVQAGAHPSVRGFVGLAFAVAGPDAYECVYLRVANGRDESQERRNHSIQYISHPDWPWARLRAEKVSQYESYVDVGEAEWIHMRIVVDATRVLAYVNSARQPALIVERIPNSGVEAGPLALWAAQGSTAHYRNLVVTRAS